MNPTQPQLESLCGTASRGRPSGGSHRPPSQQQQQQGFTQEEAPDSEPQTQSHPHATHTSHAQEDPLLAGSSVSATGPPAAAAGLAHQGKEGSRSSTDSPSVGSLGDAGQTIAWETTLSLHLPLELDGWHGDRAGRIKCFLSFSNSTQKPSFRRGLIKYDLILSERCGWDTIHVCDHMPVPF